MKHIKYLFQFILIILFFLIFRKSNEALTNISKQDLEGIQNITSMYKNGELKVAKLHVTDDAQFDKKISSKNLHIKDNAQFDKNITVTEKITSKHLHVNDHSSTRRLDIRNDANKGTTHFNYAHQGKNYIRGHNHDKFSTDHIHVSDYLDTRRLDIRNDKTGGHPTHFNHDHSGTNHIRGNTHSAVGKLHCDNLHVNDYSYTKRLDIKGKRGTTHFNHDNKGKTYFRDDIGDTADLVKFGNNFYLFQIDGWGGNRYVHGHKGDRIGVAHNQYKTKFRIDK